MNFATWSIRNPIPTVLLFVLLALAGLWGLRSLPIQNLPDLDLPTVNVTLTEPGAAPAQLETEVARRVEDSLATLSGIKHIRTSVTDGQVSLVTEFVLEKPLSDALIETKDAVDRIRSELPQDVQEPSVSAVNIGGDPVLVYAVRSPRMDEEALSWFVDDTVGKAILGVPGVGRFQRVGGVDREVRMRRESRRPTFPMHFSRYSSSPRGGADSLGMRSRRSERSQQCARPPNLRHCRSRFRADVKSGSIRSRLCATA